MIIIIDDKIRINDNGSSFALMERNKRKSKESWEEFAWFTTLGAAVRAIARKRLATKKTLVSVREYVAEYVRITEELSKLAKASVKGRSVEIE